MHASHRRRAVERSGGSMAVALHPDAVVVVPDDVLRKFVGEREAPALQVVFVAGERSGLHLELDRHVGGEHVPREVVEARRADEGEDRAALLPRLILLRVGAVHDGPIEDVDERLPLVSFVCRFTGHFDVKGSSAHVLVRQADL